MLFSVTNNSTKKNVLVTVSGALISMTSFYFLSITQQYTCKEYEHRLKHKCIRAVIFKFLPYMSAIWK